MARITISEDAGFVQAAIDNDSSVRPANPFEKSLDEDLVRIQKQLTELGKVQLATEPYQPSLQKVAEMRTHAAKIRVPDPIGSQTIQASAREVLRSVGSLTERILQHRRGIDELQGKLNTCVQIASGDQRLQQ